MKKKLLECDEKDFQGSMNKFIDLCADDEKINNVATKLKEMKSSSPSPSQNSNKRSSDAPSTPSPMKKQKFFHAMNPEEKQEFFDERVSSQSAHETNFDFLSQIVEVFGDSLTWSIMDGMVSYTESDVAASSPLEFASSELKKEEQKKKESEMKIKFYKKLLPSTDDSQ